MKSRRSTRIKAAELAAQCLGGEMAAGGAVAGRLFGLVIFFELYIDHGTDRAEQEMHLLEPREGQALRVVAGGNLGSKLS